MGWAGLFACCARQEMARLQQASRNVIALTGRLTQRLPPDAYGKLSQMDVVMS